MADAPGDSDFDTLRYSTFVFSATRRNRVRCPALKCQSGDEKEAERKRTVRRLRARAAATCPMYVKNETRHTHCARERRPP